MRTCKRRVDESFFLPLCWVRVAFTSATATAARYLGDTYSCFSGFREHPESTP